ncbi:chromosome segregation protein SMC [Pseudoroseicyclus tamaricis]|uniref:Chromosome partition protein Smc n=1 Tax=Pseudoroseicyclus tamaricis TaxID=2705421 RepID=A0A6B2K2F0_9RHOB|nr:chromosome segregation protein SMC [Pseudoroseicyclus tamaricis]NDV01952.1 chromosome segregation protein SMC [Pseudoroseicyclus tamaricis]
MRFTRLRLNGFKSFVDPTDLVIHDGLTGVVGPNGCGKSNLLEALRWVMGETRPTAMRGGGMEDVIFAGAATRSARNHAEVALHIDNSDRLAPAAFNDTDQIEITRRITRDVGSAYRLGGKEVRARDVQMLFADASTGAHSPALVRQGQISELINAKPAARRRILEEAAGISGLYQRRHEAELKLNGAEQNLARVDDVVEQLAGQLAQLARQAKAAARYREIGAKLREAEGLLLWRRWREAGAALEAAEQGLRERVLGASRAEAEARAAEAARDMAEEAMPALREEEAIAAALAQRLALEAQALREDEARARRAIERLRATLAQVEKDGAREAELTGDAEETLARLAAEAEELAAAGEGHESRLTEEAEAARAAAEALAERESALSERTEDAARLAARHQSAQRLIEDRRALKAKAEEAMARARTARGEAAEALERAEAEYAAARDAEAGAGAAATAAEAALGEAEATRAETQGQEAEARAARSGAEGEASALTAEVRALERLVARDTAEGGQVLDLLSVAPGYEKALGAALADDLRAPKVGSGDATGWAELAPYEADQPLPGGAEPLADHMEVPAVLARRIAQVGLVAAAEGPALQERLQPGQRLVSREGDLWRWDGYRAGAEDAPSAAALRLQQLNRLAELRRDLSEAEARAEEARAAHGALATTLAEQTEAEKLARAARREAEGRVAEASRRASRAEAERNIAEGKRESAQLAGDRHEAEAREAEQALREAESAAIPEAELAAAKAAVEELRTGVEAARLAMIARRTAHDELRREGEARAKRAGTIAREQTSWQERLASAGSRRADLAARQEQAGRELSSAEGRPGVIGAKREALEGSIAKAEARKTAATEALTGGEAALREATVAAREAEAAAGQAREARAGAEARRDAAREAVAGAEARIEEALEQSPEDLRAELGAAVDGAESAEEIETRIGALRRQRDALGAVNLRAEEDSQEVSAEHDLLVKEKADLEQAIHTLRHGIAALNKEGRERLLTAFEQVNGNFSMLFTHLFGGGEARLELVESDDPLNAGLEILCQPPGKKLSTLSLLSGGEQTLTALALIFAVFLANPAPICVLDEVDAPLDDANVTRFCDMLDEMTRRTQTRFLIITHHAVTMARMDRLFGVTMGEQGVSQLVSVDLKKAEALVA